MFKSIIAALDGNKPRRQRSPDGIGRTAIGTAAAVGTGIEIKDMLPGKILKDLDAKRIQIIELFV